MDVSLRFDTINLNWSIIYLYRGHMLQYIVFLSLTIISVLANSVDTHEMPHYAAFYLGLHCLPMYPFKSH